MIRKLAISSILVLGFIISAIVETSLNVKQYFAISFAIVFAFYWTAEFSFEYFQFRKTYESKFKIYKAKIVNEKNISLDIIEKNEKVYYKKFKKSMIKNSFLNFAKPMVAFSLAVCMILGLVL